MQAGNDDMLSISAEDEYLFGWNPTPGIVSVWASRDGRAMVWRRVGDKIIRSSERYRPWLLATSLRDVEHLGTALQPHDVQVPEKVLVRYRGLEGPASSYGYLLFARDTRSLERSIMEGAGLRLQRPVHTFADLKDDYYRVGPVEQYLMSTGKVYFRGLVYNDLHRLQFDLETTALDPHRGRIFLVAVRDSHGLERVLEAPAPEDEARLIHELCALIRERDPDVIENHNLFGFDLPFLEHRAVVQRVPLELGREGGPLLLDSYPETLAVGPDARKRMRYSVAGRELIDTLDAVRRHDFVVRDIPSYGLKEVAKYFGLASPDRVYIEGADIFKTYQSDPAVVRHYALDDVREVDGLSCRLLGAPFALASMAPRRYERLTSAGPAMGVLEPILVRSYLRMGAALPYQAAQQSAEAGLHEGGAVHLFASGIAEQVVKADVASLYPSLMRTFRIGPSCDRLGIFLNILGRLTDLRLEHKDLARRADPFSIEANHHAATQAAMKILINAAYGYMGAGSMALFADGKAAGEVTRRGRAVLGQILDALRQRGMALIEADTDGVYFSVPAGWSEQQEQALVNEIGAGLPAGIHLEYEGRYRAMLSHEVKNYALLTYGGRLLVHGVALRSSRAEPFGERFLHQALQCVMIGDVVGIRACYLQTIADLRDRRLPASDLATRVRLSKAPETYLAQRRTHTEPAYEALLHAGRTQWHVGERVRFYRTRKGYVWLPDETEEATVVTDWRKRADGKLEPQQKKVLVTHQEVAGRRDYEVEHYVQLLRNSYAARLSKAFSKDAFEQLFRFEQQPSLFDVDPPIETLQPRWIRNP
ncbi:DNA polymerase domain-containing protein [Dictyobacter arantiisoli]|uniref:DNA-directed DNA polymerase n=1 Tax=Dictyobacter arantiisoli TaxID=2014874 RepID=A0A5A5TAQ0_9CHLR|nr:DNA polymerase domain-containing protein [Dictyobacter arantiisoli]GCF08561.1 DNA polymerase II [Dictyobacter arantiisoli]